MTESGRSAPVVRAPTQRKRSRGRARRRRRKAVDPTSAAPKRHPLALATMRITDFYRPLKKPVTLRLDADVIAWFKKDGRRYQTRINAALRKVMEREMKSAQ